ncbi:maltose ABC transporter substrate-binding protein [Treponema brennaborense]|uniref:Extracellular solute-binding protein family 1 n=1 Tax=Treponema brennaborense (strain DSM 12168 / CIP 105900 / DD5/3) TaxID=906968 RepID=F4LQA7_TREBD|nr:maltose ABC transporter substrate-binding protein [Treponema brennaborense]AEE16128.1 extracellular solute-binding protein family 1 [Treponema brennaborense DSM 12168]
MKKLITTVLLVLLAAGFVFAGGQGDSGKTVLKVWESEGPEKDFVLWAAAEFEKTHPDIKIVYEPVGSNDSRAKIELDGPAGVGADVFVAPHDHIGALINGGHVLPNTDPDFASTFIEAAVTGATYKGVVYGYPQAIETYALFYNKDIIANPPKTWAEIEKFGETWTDKSQNKFPIVWEVANAYYDYIFMGGFGALLFGPNGDDRSQHNINSAQAIEGLTYFQSLRKKLLDVPSADVSGDFCNSSFIEGKAAMYIVGPWKIDEFTKAKMNFGIVPIPVFPGQKNPPASFSGVRLAFVSAYSDHPEEAAEFAKFLTSKPILEKRYEMTQQIPPRKDITIDNQYSNGIMAQAKFASPMPTIPQMGTFWSAMNTAFASIWDGADVRENLKAAAAAMESAR